MKIALRVVSTLFALTQRKSELPLFTRLRLVIAVVLNFKQLEPSAVILAEIDNVRISGAQ